MYRLPHSRDHLSISSSFCTQPATPIPPVSSIISIGACPLVVSLSGSLLSLRRGLGFNLLGGWAWLGLGLGLSLSLGLGLSLRRLGWARLGLGHSVGLGLGLSLGLGLGLGLLGWAWLGLGHSVGLGLGLSLSLSLGLSLRLGLGLSRLGGWARLRLLLGFGDVNRGLAWASSFVRLLVFGGGDLIGTSDRVRERDTKEMVNCYSLRLAGVWRGCLRQEESRNGESGRNFDHFGG